MTSSPLQVPELSPGEDGMGSKIPDLLRHPNPAFQDLNGPVYSVDFTTEDKDDDDDDDAAADDNEDYFDIARGVEQRIVSGNI